MSESTIQLTPHLYEYFLKVSLREPEVLKALRQRTSTLTMHRMQLSAEQGQLIRLLVELMNAKKTLDIGTFTGYSSLSAALGIPKDGQVITCDTSKEWTHIAKEFWEKAGVSHKITLKLAPAEKTLDALLQAGEGGTFDFAFIDADKKNYLRYYEQCLQLLRPGGLIAVDNVLWGGSVADLSDNENETVAIREFNEKVYRDERVLMSMLPLGDGLTLVRKI